MHTSGPPWRDTAAPEQLQKDLRVRDRVSILNHSQTWYHGSPYELTMLRAGSTITQNRDLAQAFSHKPALLCVSDEGRIRHNGTAPGYLYRLSEPVGPDDVYAHPRSTMEPGAEWLTRRELRVELIGPVEVAAEERLNDEEVERYRQMLQADKGVDRDL